MPGSWHLRHDATATKDLAGGLFNALGPSRDELEREVRALYQAAPDAEGVLEAHARVHFGHGLVSSRLLPAHAHRTSPRPHARCRRRKRPSPRPGWRRSTVRRSPPKATLAALAKARDALRTLAERRGRAGFEIDL